VCSNTEGSSALFATNQKLKKVTTTSSSSYLLRHKNFAENKLKKNADELEKTEKWS